MIPQLEARLKDLREEFANGEQKLGDLNAQVAQLRDTLLRISGAIQVLEEELSKAENEKVQADNSVFEETTHADTNG
jgi:uncharacterized coiled-coil protein SlyX